MYLLLSQEWSVFQIACRPSMLHCRQCCVILFSTASHGCTAFTNHAQRIICPIRPFLFYFRGSSFPTVSHSTLPYLVTRSTQFIHNIHLQYNIRLLPILSWYRSQFNSKRTYELILNFILAV